ncbi:uncharacterized protein ACRADG_013072 [Cochliomyia hominivorax]
MCLIKIGIFKLFPAIILLLLQLIKANFLLENIQNSIKQSENHNLQFQSLLEQIEKENCFKTCIIFGKPLNDFPVEKILQEDMKKLIVLHQNIENVNECCGYHNKFLGIIYWHQEPAEELMGNLARILYFKRHNKLLVIKSEVENDTNFKDIEQLFKISKFHKFSHLILILKDFYKSLNYYQYHLYPKFIIEKQNFIPNSTVLYPKKMKNLHGSGIRTIPDQVLPRSAAIIDDKGQLQVKGYIMKFLHLFSKYLNASLEYPLKISIDKSLLRPELYNLTQQDLIDIPASMLTYSLPNSSMIMSNAYEINTWCTIVPIESPLTLKEFLDQYVNQNFVIFLVLGRLVFSTLFVFSKKLWCLKNNSPCIFSMRDIIINPNVISGMYGGSFRLLPDPSKSMRFIYISLFLFALAHTTLVSTRMQVFLTHPYSHRIKKINDLPLYNLRLLIANGDYQFMLNYFKYPNHYISQVFEVTSSYEEFNRIQSSWNTSYAYPIPSTLWFIYDALQTYTNKRIFRLTSICFPYTGIMAFILPPNSLFMKPLNVLIGRVRDMGLMDFWLKTSYIELVDMKKVHMPGDLPVVEKSSMLLLQDLKYIWISMIRGLICAFFIFLGEIIWHKFSCRRNRQRI